MYNDLPEEALMRRIKTVWGKTDLKSYINNHMYLLKEVSRIKSHNTAVRFT